MRNLSFRFNFNHIHDIDCKLTESFNKIVNLDPDLHYQMIDNFTLIQ